jgi:hypothetical protein
MLLEWRQELRQKAGLPSKKQFPFWFQKTYDLCLKLKGWVSILQSQKETKTIQDCGRRFGLYHLGRMKSILSFSETHRKKNIVKRGSMK